MRSEDETVAIAKVIDRVNQRFPDLPQRSVESVVWAEYQLFNGHPVRDFVPILVERAAKARLSAMRGTALVVSV